MIYLVSQIFFYLAIAMITGVVTGWLLAQLRRRSALAALGTQVNQLRRDVARRDEALVVAEQRAAELAAQALEPKVSPALAEMRLNCGNSAMRRLCSSASFSRNFHGCYKNTTPLAQVKKRATT